MSGKIVELCYKSGGVVKMRTESLVDLSRGTVCCELPAEDESDILFRHVCRECDASSRSPKVSLRRMPNLAYRGDIRF